MQWQEGLHATVMTEVANAHKAIDDAESEASTQVGDESWSFERMGEDGAGVDGKLREPAFSRGETLIIFDWDDTLLPTSWLQELGLLVSEEITLTAEQWTHLQVMAIAASTSLTYALTFGKVVIVTNAGEGWVEASCRTFMPCLEPLLAELSVVSARSTCADKDPCAWKRDAFRREVSSYFGQDHCGWQNIVSIGDSLFEVQALLEVGGGAEHRIGKSVKLMACPHVEQMIAQHELMRDNLREVVEHDDFLDLEIDTEANDDGDTEG